MKKALVSIYLSLSLFLLPTAVLPFETDQFNLPPTPLADIGEEVSEYVSGILTATVNEVNAEIDRLEKCLEVRAKGCPKTDVIGKTLTELRSPESFAKAFYEHIAGDNFMTTKFGKWMNSHNFRSQPARYKAPYKESIYILNPFNYATLSPTVRLYGHEFGIDKLEHLFQQGYQYYKIYQEEIAKGSSTEAATEKAIKWGQKTERTYYGLMTSGVFSNADLFANYAGIKFYQGLTHSNGFGILLLKGGKWHMDKDDLEERLLKPFIADHMNEALNPSSYRFTLIRSVRRSVSKYACPDWRLVRSDNGPERVIPQSSSIRYWNGIDYGYVEPSRFASITEICQLDK